MPPNRDEGVTREGMEGWTRENDNRMRELTRLKERNELSEAEAKELKKLSVTNEKFIEAGLRFQRGEGIDTWHSVIVLAGYTVGLGNLWRFPYLAGRFGGLSFIIAYAVCLVFVAHPIYLLELAFGQSMKKSTVFAYAQIGKQWVGVGFACVIALVLVQSYYSVLLAYSSVYIAHSFVSPLPWTREALPHDLPGNMSAAEYYWKARILGQDFPNDGYLGAVQYPLVIGLLVSYIVVYLAVFKGITVGAKITYVTVGLPVLLILILCIRSLFLAGAGSGIAYFIGRFDIVSFSNPVMWAEACSQTLFTLLFLPGTSITLASYMRSKEDIYRINIIMICLNTAFSFVSGLTVFAILGYVADASCESGDSCSSVEDYAKNGGAGLVFIAIAEGIGTLGSGSNVFAFTFFLMCFLLGLDTTFAGLETLITYTEDFLWYSQQKKYSRELIAGGCVVVLFLAGLMYCTSNGFALLDVVDHFVTTYTMLIVCALECIMYRFGMTWDEFSIQIQLATTGLDYINKGRGRELPKFLNFCLKITAPLACCGLAFTLFIYDCIYPYRAAGQEPYTAGYQATGWVLVVTNLLVIPIGGYYNTRKSAEDKSIRTPEAGHPSGEGNERLLVDKPAEDLENPAPTTEMKPYEPPRGTGGTGQTAEMRRQLEAIGEEVLSEGHINASTLGSDSPFEDD